MLSVPPEVMLPTASARRVQELAGHGDDLGFELAQAERTPGLRAFR